MRVIAAVFGGAIVLSGATTDSLATLGNGLNTPPTGEIAVHPWIVSSNVVVATNNGVVPKDHPMHHFYQHKYRTPNSSGHGRRRR
jgi:hypothetical protein